MMAVMPAERTKAAELIHTQIGELHFVHGDGLVLGVPSGDRHGTRRAGRGPVEEQENAQCVTMSVTMATQSRTTSVLELRVLVFLRQLLHMLFHKYY